MGTTTTPGRRQPLDRWHDEPVHRQHQRDPKQGPPESPLENARQALNDECAEDAPQAAPKACETIVGTPHGGTGRML